MTTLLSVVGKRPNLFYEQIWWLEQAFARVPMRASITFDTNSRPPSAVEIADLFTRHPEHPAFKQFIWTRDVDHEGNVVYVGGVGIYGIDKFQIHRLLTPDERWRDW